MEMTQLSRIDSVYICNSSLVIQRHLSEHAGLEKFCSCLWSFKRELGESIGDEYWRSFWTKLRRYVFRLSTFPLPFCHPAVSLPQELALLREKIADCGLLFPQCEPGAQQLLDLAETISLSEEAPLLDQVEKLMLDPGGEGGSRDDTALLVTKASAIPDIEQFFTSRGQTNLLHVVACDQLRKNRCYSRILMLGTASLHPEYVTAASRAGRVHIFHFGWYRDEGDPVGFTTSQVQTSPDLKWRPAGAKGRLSLGAADISPPVNWDSVSGQAAEQFGREATSELVEGQLFLVEGGSTICLEASENAKALVINMDAEQSGPSSLSPVQQVLISEIDPGMCVLVRTEGGGDYVAPLADRILGEYADEARESQRDWKARLRTVWEREGTERVVDSLAASGSSKANQVNLKNWMSPSTISPKSRGDFEAIGKLLGLDPTEKFWRNAQRVRSAHQRAGQNIRLQLLEQVKSTPLGALERQGSMVFQLSEAHGGSLTAFRVREKAPGTVSVPVSHLGRLLDGTETD